MDYLIQNSSAFAAMVNGSSYGAQKLLDTNIHTTVSDMVSGLSVWQVLLTLLVVAVTYDQCTNDISPVTGAVQKANWNSYVSTPQRSSGWTYVQDPPRRSIYPSALPRFHEI